MASTHDNHPNSAFADLFQKRADELEDRALAEELKNYATKLQSWVDTWHKNQLWSVNLAPELVAHDEHHAESVDRLASQIVAPYWNPDDPTDFSPLELVWLSMACWLHDWGHCGGILEGKGDEFHWISHSIQVRRLHGLLSRGWLRVEWNNLHGIEEDIFADPAGVLCAHHQGWTSGGEEPHRGADNNDAAGSLPGNDDTMYWSRETEELGSLLRKLNIKVHSLYDDWTSHVCPHVPDVSQDHYPRFRTLLAILRVADAADLGRHRVPTNDKTRHAQLRACMLREILTAPRDKDKSGNIRNHLAEGISVFLSDDNLNRNLDLFERWYDKLQKRESGTIPGHITDYFQYIKKQRDHIDIHRRIAERGVSFRRDGTYLCVDITPSHADQPGHERVPEEKIESDMMKFLARELESYRPDSPDRQFPLATYLPGNPAKIDVSVRPSQLEAAPKPKHVTKERGAAVDSVTVDEPVLQKPMSKGYDKGDGVIHSPHDERTGGPKSRKADSDEETVASSRSDLRQTIENELDDEMLRVLYWTATELSERDGGIAPSELGQQLTRHIDAFNEGCDDGGKFEKPWGRSESGKPLLHQYLTGLGVGIWKSQPRKGALQGLIYWEDAKSWLAENSGMFTLAMEHTAVDQIVVSRGKPSAPVDDLSRDIDDPEWWASVPASGWIQYWMCDLIDDYTNRGKKLYSSTASSEMRNRIQCHHHRGTARYEVPWGTSQGVGFGAYVTAINSRIAVDKTETGSAVITWSDKARKEWRERSRDMLREIEDECKRVRDVRWNEDLNRSYKRHKVQVWMELILAHIFLKQDDGISGKDLGSEIRKYRSSLEREDLSIWKSYPSGTLRAYVDNIRDAADSVTLRTVRYEDWGEGGTYFWDNEQHAQWVEENMSRIPDMAPSLGIASNDIAGLAGLESEDDDSDRSRNRLGKRLWNKWGSA